LARPGHGGFRSSSRWRGNFRNVPWLWFLVGAVMVIGVVVVVLVLRYMGVRDSVVTGGWLAQGIDAYR
jgi:hypothetical protein